MTRVGRCNSLSSVFQFRTYPWDWRFLASLAIAMVFLSGQAAATEMVVRVDLSSARTHQVEELLKLHPDILARGDGWVDILGDESKIEELRDLNLKTEVRIADARAYEANLRARDYFDFYHDYQEIVDEITQVEQDYPHIVKIYDIGDSWEKTEGIADRDIWALKISDNVDEFEREEPEVLLLANIHAREIITPEIALYMIHYLVDNYGTDPRVTRLVDERQIWIIPNGNPDGLDYVHHQDIWWRKNRRDNGDGTFGVDLNRNYGYMWGYDDIGSSPDPSSNVYRGTGPFSEPESQAIRDLFEAHTFVISLSYHSWGNMWLYPWGYIPEDTADHPTFVAIADSCVAYNGYEPGNAASGTIYIVNGDTDDWFYGEQTTKYKTFGFTPEVGGLEDQFHPDTTRVEALIMENLFPNIYVIDAVEEYSPRPIIAHEPLGDTEDLVGPYLVEAGITAPVWPLDESNLELHYRWDGGSFQTVSLMPTGEPDQYQASIPGPGTSGTYQYYLSASDSIPRIGYAPPGAPDSLFEFRVWMDAIPPTIVHVPLGDQGVGDAPYGVLAEVTDNIGVDSVWMEYRVNLGSLEIVPLLPQGNDMYQGWIDPQGTVPGDTLQYRLFARDEAAAQNMATLPDEGFFVFTLIQGHSFDFEATNGGFVASQGGDWEWGSPSAGPGSAYSGQHVWGTNLDGNYADDSNSTLDTPSMSLVNATEPILTFWHWYRMEYGDGVYWDGGNVKVSTDGGESFQLLYPEDGYDGVLTNFANPMCGEPVFGGPPSTGNFWHQETFDLSSFINRDVIIRFHFASDAYVTDVGWYVDAVVLTTPQSEVPLFVHTTQLPATGDTLGPYVVTSEITDDTGIEAASLHYRTSEGRFVRTPMTTQDGLLYAGEIPGQPYGTMVEYYVSALDTDSHMGSDPAGAPDSAYSFLVTESMQLLGPLPESFFFSADPGETAGDTLTIANLGQIELTFSLSDSCAEEPIPGMHEVITDPTGDIPAGVADFIALRAELMDESVVLEVVFAPGLPETTLAIVSLDLDQDPDTGARPPGLGLGSEWHDVGSEVEIIFDRANYFADQMGTQEPSAVILSADGSVLIGLIALQLGQYSASAEIPLSLLGDEGNMNVCVVSISDLASGSAMDFAPDIGHGVIGIPGDALWLTAVPESGTVPGESSVHVQLVADATYLPQGLYGAYMTVSTNDPLHQSTTILVRFQVGSVPADNPAPMPQQLTLQAWPNPFNENVSLSLGLPDKGHVAIRIYDLLGRRVCTVAEDEMAAGWHHLTWDGKSSRGRGVASGVYLCRTVTPDGSMTLRLVKTK